MAKITHGLTRSPEYRCWLHMKDRCENPNSQRYYTHGARGIKVCSRWLTFEGFITDVGFRPSPQHSLERKDNDGDYEPDNCKWATPHEQSRNKTTTIWVSVDGELCVLADAMKEFRILPHGLYYRVRKMRESHQQAVDHYVALRREQRGA